MLGNTASFPLRPDVRGSLAVTTTDDEIITESLRDLIETRQGERLMMPDYGLPDVIFDPLDASFVRVLGAILEEQVSKYITAIERIAVESSATAGHSAEVKILYWRRKQRLPQELLYPTWRFFNAND